MVVKLSKKKLRTCKYLNLEMRHKKYFVKVIIFNAFKRYIVHVKELFKNRGEPGLNRQPWDLQSPALPLSHCPNINGGN